MHNLSCGSLGLTLDGPPGMHPVGDVRWNEEHEEFANKNLDQCKSCHGNQLQGTRPVAFVGNA